MVKKKTSLPKRSDLLKKEDGIAVFTLCFSLSDSSGKVSLVAHGGACWFFQTTRENFRRLPSLAGHSASRRFVDYLCYCVRSRGTISECSLTNESKDFFYRISSALSGNLYIQALSQQLDNNNGASANWLFNNWSSALASQQLELQQPTTRQLALRKMELQQTLKQLELNN